MSKEILSDDLLKESLRKAQELRISMYDKQIDHSRQHIFSEKYRVKMNKLENEIEHKVECKITPYITRKKSLKFKILLVAVIVMLMGAMTVLAVEIIREYDDKIIELIIPDDTNEKKQKW